MIQETHLNLEESKKLKQRWVGQVFSSPGSRGVSILISKKISFELTDLVSDKEGRYLSVASENIPKQWRFNNSLLKDDTFISLIENKSKEYISINVDSLSSIQTVWEAFKATCRGWIISHASAKHRKAIKKK
ncbi:hypothetical protein F7725_002249 [Dissostichus mawsoni]|uniref:Uncharacterized protein n=1 Tax=Dissostichus mawsoni TaxID=36200 RepID=A0A7J5Y254_DISMA|nr:hypothetical protein F7725_002249 [Dissostichus mawsoni]